MKPYETNPHLPLEPWRDAEMLNHSGFPVFRTLEQLEAYVRRVEGNSSFEGFHLTDPERRAAIQKSFDAPKAFRARQVAMSFEDRRGRGEKPCKVLRTQNAILAVKLMEIASLHPTQSQYSHATIQACREYLGLMFIAVCESNPSGFTSQIIDDIFLLKKSVDEIEGALFTNSGGARLYAAFFVFAVTEKRFPSSGLELRGFIKKATGSSNNPLGQIGSSNFTPLIEMGIIPRSS